MAVFHDPDDVCGAWQALTAEMPEGWWLRSLLNVTTGAYARERNAIARRGPHWRAVAVQRNDLGMVRTGMVGIGATPAEALWRLADHLTNVGHR